MNFEYPFLELLIKLISYMILVFGVWAVIQQYTSGRLISKLELRLHYFTNRDGERVLHAPALKEPKVWEIFDIMTACIICHRDLKMVTFENDFVSICHECVKKQNQKRFKIFSSYKP